MMLDLNAGPKKRKPGYSFSICHSNLNSIAAHNLEKLGLLKTYYTGNKFDINFLSESYLVLLYYLILKVQVCTS